MRGRTAGVRKIGLTLVDPCTVQRITRCQGVAAYAKPGMGMKRREFIALFVSAASLPAVARAQKSNQPKSGR